MVERRGSARLAAEPGDRLVVLRERLGQELQRDVPAETGVLGLIDHAHPTGTQLADDAIVGNGLPDHGVSAMLGTARRDVNVARESGSQRRQEAGEKRP